ncbi:MAG: zf-HC2 domain-containing protein [Anaerolineae bacterium]
MRTTCRHCRALLPGYINRELTPPQRARVSRHLNSCAECYVAYIEQRQLVQELDQRAAHRGEPPRLDKMRAIRANGSAGAARKRGSTTPATAWRRWC